MDKYLGVNFTYTEESTMLIQIKFSDTMRVAVTQGYIIYIIIASEILFLFQQSRIENPDDIKNVLGL